MIFNFYNNDNIQELYIQNPILRILEIILKNIVKDNSITVNRNQNFIYYFTLCNEHLGNEPILESIMSIFPQCDRMVINAKMFSLKKENDNYFIYYSDPQFIEKLQKIVIDFLKMK